MDKGVDLQTTLTNGTEMEIWKYPTSAVDFRSSNKHYQSDNVGGFEERENEKMKDGEKDVENEKKKDGEKDVENPSVTVVPVDVKPILSPIRQLLSLWYVAVIFITPLILLPIPLVINKPSADCAYVILIMIVFWITEVLPIAVTSLIPVFLLPMMGLMTAHKTAALYMNDTSMLLLGGLMVATSIERWNLHRRIAMSVLLVIGTEPRWSAISLLQSFVLFKSRINLNKLLLGIMGVTWLLSMWISNSATTAMMMPIVQVVLSQLKELDQTDEDQHPNAAAGSRQQTEYTDNTDTNDDTDNKSVWKEDDMLTVKLPHSHSASMKQLAKAMSLSVAYAANVGGIACLTGTASNFVLLGHSQIIYEAVGLATPISFSTWFVYGLPLSIVLLTFLWVWLQVFFFRCKGGCDCIFMRGDKSQSKEKSARVKAVIRAEFNKLGPISYAEVVILFLLFVLVVLWITRDLGGAGGWRDAFKKGLVSDSTPAILTGVLMFVLPSQLPDILFHQTRQEAGTRGVLSPLLDWKTLHEKMPWSLYLLLGAGFAIAKAAQESGLSLWLGLKLAVFGSLDPWLMLLIICYIVTFATEITSNVAIANLMMPIMHQLALTLNVNPLFFMFPCAITSSFAFMLPIATPPNAIVFSYGTLRVVDMVLCGLVTNLVSVPILLLATMTWGNAFFHFTELPPEFLVNSTVSVGEFLVNSSVRV